MTHERRSGGNPAPIEAPQRLRDAASELLVGLTSKLDVLDCGSEETRRITHELQMLIEEVRQALGEGTQD